MKKRLIILTKSLKNMCTIEKQSNVVAIWWGLNKFSYVSLVSVFANTLPDMVAT